MPIGPTKPAASCAWKNAWRRAPALAPPRRARSVGVQRRARQRGCAAPRARRQGLGKAHRHLGHACRRRGPRRGAAALPNRNGAGAGAGARDMTDAIAGLAGALGILPRYTDQMGGIRETGRDTALALMAAMGMMVSTEAEAEDRLAARQADAARRVLPRFVILTPDTGFRLPADPGAWVIALEDGPEIEGHGPDLPPLPLGRHVLRAAGEETTLLTASLTPAAAPARLGGDGTALGPAPTRTRGLWRLRRPQAHGPVAGAGRRGISGHQPDPRLFPDRGRLGQPASPSHRRRLNPLHIATGERCRRPPVDYPAEIPTKRAALRAAYDAFAGDMDFDAFCVAEGAALTLFAAHQALSERHGALWTDWPCAPARSRAGPLSQAARRDPPIASGQAWRIAS